MMRKIRNKERCGFRGKKERNSVWRNKYNQAWEKCDERQVIRLCVDNNLNIWDHYVDHPTIPWECTFDSLWDDKGYRFNRKSHVDSRNFDSIKHREFIEKAGLETQINRPCSIKKGK